MKRNVLDEEWRSQHRHLVRWWNTVLHQVNLLEVLIFLMCFFNIYNFCAFFVFLLLCLINYRWTSCVPRDLKYLGVGWMNMAGFYLIFLHPIR